MEIEKRELFVQVIYRHMLDGMKPAECAQGMNAELYISIDEIGKLDREILAGFKAYLKRAGLKARMHAPILDLDYRDADALADSLSDIYRSVFDVCEFFTSPAVVTHAEFTDGKDIPVEKQAENAVTVWKKIALDAEKRGIMLLVENHTEKDPGLVAGFVEKIGKKGTVGACFDAAHYNAFGKYDIAGCLKRYPAGSIGEVHLSDNLGDTDSHLPLGKGSVDFSAFFAAMGKRADRPVYTLEPQDPGELQESLLFLRKTGVLVG